MKRQASRANHNQILQHIHRQKYGFPPSMLKAELATTTIALIIIGVCLYLFN